MNRSFWAPYCAVALGVSLVTVGVPAPLALAAYEGPTQPFPDGNPPAPVDTGTVGQAKAGWLGFSGFVGTALRLAPDQSIGIGSGPLTGQSVFIPYTTAHTTVIYPGRDGLVIGHVVGNASQPGKLCFSDGTCRDSWANVGSGGGGSYWQLGNGGIVYASATNPGVQVGDPSILLPTPLNVFGNVNVNAVSPSSTTGWYFQKGVERTGLYNYPDPNAVGISWWYEIGINSFSPRLSFDRTQNQCEDSSLRYAECVANTYFAASNAPGIVYELFLSSREGPGGTRYAPAYYEYTKYQSSNVGGTLSASFGNFSGGIGIGTAPNSGIGLSIKVAAPRPAIQILSGDTASSTSITLGRTSIEGTLGVAARLGDITNFAAAGDTVLKGTGNVVLTTTGAGSAVLVGVGTTGQATLAVLRDAGAGLGKVGVNIPGTVAAGGAGGTPPVSGAGGSAVAGIFTPSAPIPGMLTSYAINIPAVAALSGVSGRHTSFALGRTDTEANLGIAGSNANYSLLATPGDVVLRTGTEDLIFSAAGAIRFAIERGLYVSGQFMVIDQDGKVGIGTEPGNTSHLVTVAGSVNSTGGFFKNGVEIGTGGGGTPSQWSGTAPGSIYYTGTNVGIGTATPSANWKLDVVGNVGLNGELNQYGGSYVHLAQSNPAYALRLGEVYGNGGIYKATGNLQFDLGTGANFLFTSQNNEVARLSAAGDLRLSGASTLTLGSGAGGTIRGGSTNSGANTFYSNSSSTNGSWIELFGAQSGGRQGEVTVGSYGQGPIRFYNYGDGQGGVGNLYKINLEITAAGSVSIPRGNLSVPVNVRQNAYEYRQATTNNPRNTHVGTNEDRCSCDTLANVHQCGMSFYSSIDRNPCYDWSEDQSSNSPISWVYERIGGGGITVSGGGGFFGTGVSIGSGDLPVGIKPSLSFIAPLGNNQTESFKIENDGGAHLLRFLTNDGSTRLTIAQDGMISTNNGNFTTGNGSVDTLHLTARGIVSIPSGAGQGLVLTSNETGLASWAPLPSPAVGRKLCIVVGSNNNFIDTVNVNDGWTVDDCRSFAQGYSGYGNFYIGCLTNSGVTRGAIDGGVPNPNCGWNTQPGTWRNVTLSAGAPGQSCLDWLTNGGQLGSQRRTNWTVTAQGQGTQTGTDYGKCAYSNPSLQSGCAWNVETYTSPDYRPVSSCSGSAPYSGWGAVTQSLRP